MTVDFSDGLVSVPNDTVRRQGLGKGGNSERVVFHSEFIHSHHDMLFCAYKKNKKITVCVQCRHGEHKNWQEVQKQCYTEGGSLVDLLLVVNQRSRVYKGGKALTPEELQKCVFVDSSVFCDNEALFVYHPTNKNVRKKAE